MFDKTLPMTLSWQGALSREISAELRKELIVALMHAEQVTVNLSEVTSFDISCLLLLCAAHRHARGMRQSLLVTGTKNPAVSETVQRYGYDGIKFCLPQCGNTCLWNETGMTHQH